MESTVSERERIEALWQALEAALDAGRLADVSAETSDPATPPCCAPAAVSAETPNQTDPDVSAETSGHPKSANCVLSQFDPATLQSELADAMVNVAQAYLDHAPRTLGAGYELVLMTTPELLDEGADGVGGFLRDGTPVPLHVARMLACDCSRVDVEQSASGELLNVGRARRTVPSAIGRGLWLRDGGCRVPGCGRKRHLHAHHIHNWANGGETSLANLVLLCSSHHAAVHEGRLKVQIQDGRIEFENAHGLRMKSGPGPERLAAWDSRDDHDWWRVLELIDDLEVESDRYPCWDGSRLDLDAVLSGLHAAHAWREANGV